jgi:hypothetical protein
MPPAFRARSAGANTLTGVCAFAVVPNHSYLWPYHQDPQRRVCKIQQLRSSRATLEQSEDDVAATDPRQPTSMSSLLQDHARNRGSTNTEVPSSERHITTRPPAHIPIAFLNLVALGDCTASHLPRHSHHTMHLPQWSKRHERRRVDTHPPGTPKHLTSPPLT